MACLSEFGSMSDGLDQPCPSGHGLRDAEGTRALTDTAELRFLRRLMLTFSLRQDSSELLVYHPLHYCRGSEAEDLAPHG